jgi:MFS family permease
MQQAHPAAPDSARLRFAIAILVVSELFGTSLWFSTNGVAAELRAALDLSPAGIGWLTNATQSGFIAGTLLVALTGLADRFAASRVFFVSCLLGAGANAVFALNTQSLAFAVALRFLVGVSLAGIYPLGMKLVVSWTPGRASTTLSLLVAMLAIGTALPHGVRGVAGALPWQGVVLSSSLLALVAGATVLWLGDGPHLPSAGRQPVRLGVALQAFRVPAFRAAAFGYFGHMWELYAFWALLPFLIVGTLPAAAASPSIVSLLSFTVIAIGGAGCIAGAALARRSGSQRVAAVSLAVSGLCCLLFPPAALAGPMAVLALLLLWGATVVTDSPQFSALSAAACPPHAVGSALALQNAIGFLISMVSIALSSALLDRWGTQVTWLLLPGPILGVIAILRWRG